MFVIPATGAVVIGASAGGIAALRLLFRSLPNDFVAPIFVVQHFPADAAVDLPAILAPRCPLPVLEAIDKAIILGGRIYIAPPGYHLLIEKERTIALSVDELVNWSRPSIDVLFNSSAAVYQKQLIGILLTGANSDGAKGLKAIKEWGGYVIVQDPETAESSEMPKSAINATAVDLVASLEEIATLLAQSKGA